jgi:peptide chain release factor 2
VSELEAEIARPGFWDRGDQAQELLRERTSLQKLVDTWEDAWQELEDLSLLAELGEEGEDAATLTEIRELLPALEQRVAKMEFARMLSGQHDASNAIVSINAGAGGTEAQDWAEMLLRMYLRFCEKRGFGQRLPIISPVMKLE